MVNKQVVLSKHKGKEFNGDRLKSWNNLKIHTWTYGTILYAIYVSLLFDKANLTNFADDNFALTWRNNMNDITQNIEQELEMKTKWLKNSRQVVNEGKTKKRPTVNSYKSKW